MVKVGLEVIDICPALEFICERGRKWPRKLFPSKDWSQHRISTLSNRSKSCQIKIEGLIRTRPVYNLFQHNSRA